MPEPRRISRHSSSHYEIELIPGVEDFVERELYSKLGRQAFQLLGSPREGRMTIRYEGAVGPLLEFRSAVAVHVVEQFEVARPKALLGHEHLTRLLATLSFVTGIHPPGSFETFRISAAGAESAVYRRLRDEVAVALDLGYSSDEAHLLVSVRRPPTGRGGWQALVRLTPMPLSARSWRICDRPDALNATIAHVMVSLAKPGNNERFLNLGCGSGTLLIERLVLGRSSAVVGVDISKEALDCTTENLAAAGLSDQPGLLRCDMQRLPMPDASFDTIVADLPFGMARGNPVDLDSVYAGTFSEAARLTKPRGAFVVTTTRRRLFESTFLRFTDRWKRTMEVPLRVSFDRGYLEPSVYLMRRISA